MAEVEIKFMVFDRLLIKKSCIDFYSSSCFTLQVLINFIFHLSAAGPQSFEDYFQKGAILGHKAALSLWYVDTRLNSQKL